MQTVLDLIRSLPKTETHLHIEGALPWEMLHALDPARFPHPPASHAPDFKFPDFATFEAELLDMAFSWYTSPERYHEGARAVFARHLELNVRYVEASFASGVIEFLDLDGKAIVEAIRSAVPDGMELRLFLGIHHNGCTEVMEPTLNDALTWDGLDGIDLHGTETLPLEPWTAPYYREAAERGKTCKAHAGEFCGPDFVRRVVDELGVRRIQHGVRSAEDPETVKMLAERDCVLDVCPISNIKLAVTQDIHTHPIRALDAAGVRCTVSTDDPVSFGNTLMDEYAELSKIFDTQGLLRLVRNGWERALIDEDARTHAFAQIDEAAQPLLR